MFIQNVIDFLIIAFCIFIFIRAINKLTDMTHKLEKGKKKDKEEDKEEIQETELSILKEIRDELKTKKKSKNK